MRFRSFIPPLGMMLLAAGQAGAQGVLIDKSEIRFISRQMGVNVEGRFRRWKANIVFVPKDLGRSKADFDIELGSIDLASDESEAELKRPLVQLGFQQQANALGGMSMEQDVDGNQHRHRGNTRR